MRGIIDRLENGFAVVEVDGKLLKIPLPENLQINEGECVVFENGVIIAVDAEETNSRKERIDSLMKKLFK